MAIPERQEAPGVMRAEPGSFALYSLHAPFSMIPRDLFSFRILYAHLLYHANTDLCSTT